MSLNLPDHVRRVYVHFGFPVEEWAKRFHLDFTRSAHNVRAHRIYRSIANSLKQPASDGERARLRYYEKKIEAARKAAI